jgi:predicted nucleic acid-binding protein
MELIIPYPTQIRSVINNSALLSAIKTLSRANRKTLGFLPDAVFEKSADKGWLLCAIDDENEVMGYLLYRVPEDRWVKIVHLCIAESQRNNGIAKTLITDLLHRTQHLRGLYLWSRRDFAATNVWPKLGMAAVHEKPGRSRKGTTLTLWVYERELPGLFAVRRPLLDVVIDLNIFYDLHASRDGPAESHALLADWIQDEIRLCVTSDLYNEINRLPDEAKRNTQRNWASRFDHVAGPLDEFEKACVTLKDILGSPRNKREESDLRHLARTVAAGVRFFVTRDEGLLSHASETASKVGLVVLRPTELILQLDELRSELNYYPVRLRGSQAEVKRVSSDQIDRLAHLFVAHEHGEAYRQLRQRLHILLSSPDTAHGEIIYDEGEPVALSVVDTSIPSIFDIPVLRLRRSRLAATIIRHVLMRAVEASSSEGFPITTISERYLGSPVLDAIA